ncbi:MAG: hypothetical protein J6U54_20485 [Clostridiales bacterium]|nr:hypothetical protein [Clostridiales bacterium]
MILTNFAMETKIAKLNPFLNRADIIGYAAARNTRILRDAVGAYITTRDALIVKYGQLEKDDNDRQTGRYIIPYDDPNFSTFKNELDRIGNIEHDVDIFKISYSDVMDKLTGNEILEIDWMLDD